MNDRSELLRFRQDRLRELSDRVVSVTYRQ